MSSKPIDILSDGGTHPTPKEGDGHEKPDNNNRESGHGEGKSTRGWGGGDEDEMVDIEGTIQAFRLARPDLKDSTRLQCEQQFRRFADAVNLSRYNKAQLRGKKGPQLIEMYIREHIKDKTRYSVVLSYLRAVWIRGLNIPWSIDVKATFGKMERIDRLTTPSDKLVKEWFEAVPKEPDPWLKALWLVVAQHGWRNSHVRALKWTHVTFGEDGKPSYIHVDGKLADFKTRSSIYTRLAPNTQQALIELRAACPYNTQDDYIFGHHNPSTGQYFKEQASTHLLYHWWIWLQKRHNLPKLDMRLLRHWVSTTTRKMGLSLISRCWLLGHDIKTASKAMPDQYDNPNLDDIHAEMAQKIPDGPLGVFGVPRVELVDCDLPGEVKGLVKQYLAGGIGTMELASRLERMRMDLMAQSKNALTE